MKDYFCLGEEYVFYNNMLINGVVVIAVIALLLFVSDYYIRHNFRIRLYLGNFFKSMVNNKIFTVLLLTVLIFVFIFMSLMIKTFNGGEWKFSCSTLISKEIGDWGDFATCLGAIFALISILLAYRAFMSQVNASKRTSFDATFTQMFAQHKILYDKAMQHNDSILFVSDYDKKCVKGNVKNNIFSICKNEYMKNLFVKYIYMKCYIPIKNIAKSYKRYDISKFWESFNERIGSSVSVDFKNYLKYIHNEVEFVASQPDDILDNDAKQRYIQLIQAQMNNDELFCYLINKVEFMYRHKSNLEEDTKTHAKHLRDFKFFIELCRGKSGHVDLVEMMLRDEELNVSAFIDENWIQKGKS